LCDQASARKVDARNGDIESGQCTGEYAEIKTSVMGQKCSAIKPGFALPPDLCKVGLVCNMLGANPVDGNVMGREIEPRGFNQPSLFMDYFSLLDNDHRKLASAIGSIVGCFKIDRDKIEHGEPTT
jgi:hypothetical protein